MGPAEAGWPVNTVTVLVSASSPTSATLGTALSLGSATGVFTSRRSTTITSTPDRSPRAPSSICVTSNPSASPSLEDSPAIKMEFPYSRIFPFGSALAGLGSCNMPG